MKQTIFTTALMLFVATISAQSTSPQVIASSGSFSSNGNISLSTTVGETATTTLSISTTTLTQGFQQPEYDVINSVVETVSKSLQIKVYPNPAESNITIDIVSDENSNAKLTVVDMLGKVLLQQPLSFNTANAVNLNHLPSGQYAFKITDTKGTLLSTHQIQKVN